MDKETAKRIDEHWSKNSTHSLKTRWWEFPAIHEHVNSLVCGRAVDGVSQGLNHKLKAMGRFFEHGVSVGFVDGSKEFELLKEGLVKKFTLFELSEKRIEDALNEVAAHDLLDHVTFTNEDFYSYKFTSEVDFVHWNNSLHHMLDVERAIKWSYDILEVGGVFYMDDFVGPNRFQWSDAALNLSTRIRQILPDKYLHSPYQWDQFIGRIVTRPDIQKIVEADPSEAADSQRILENVRKYFPKAEITLTGGIIYHTALNDVLANIDEFDLTDKAILDLLLIIDELATKSGIESQYAATLAVKTKQDFSGILKEKFRELYNGLMDF